MSNDNPAGPPTGADLDLTVRVGVGFTSYGVIGNVTPRPSSPVDVTLRLDQRSDREPPGAAVAVVGGSGGRVVGNAGDTICVVARPRVEPPAGVDACG